MAISGISNNYSAGNTGGVGTQMGGSPAGVGGPQNPKEILKALLARLGLMQNQNAAGGGGGQCSCGAGAGGGQSGASGGAAQRTEGMGF